MSGNNKNVKKDSIENVGIAIIMITLIVGIFKIGKELWVTDRRLFWRILIIGTTIGVSRQIIEWIN
jgi:uncharacterized protein YqhQ